MEKREVKRTITTTTTTKTTTQKQKVDYDNIDEEIYLNRQREIVRLSKNFADAVDKMLAEKPIIADIKDSRSSHDDEYEYVEEEEEEDRDDLNMNGDSLILIHEIDILTQDIHQILNGLPQSLIKKNRYLAKIAQQLNSLILHIEGLRIRAENLLTAN